MINILLNKIQTLNVFFITLFYILPSFLSSSLCWISNLLTNNSINLTYQIIYIFLFLYIINFGIIFLCTYLHFSFKKLFSKFIIISIEPLWFFSNSRWVTTIFLNSIIMRDTMAHTHIILCILLLIIVNS